jgi:hypothetical protein
MDEQRLLLTYNNMCSWVAIRAPDNFFGPGSLPLISGSYGYYAKSVTPKGVMASTFWNVFYSTVICFAVVKSVKNLNGIME